MNQDERILLSGLPKESEGAKVYSQDPSSISHPISRVGLKDLRNFKDLHTTHYLIISYLYSILLLNE